MPRPQCAGISAASVKAARARLAVLLASANPLPANPMLSILNLALPFFGVIFIGFACGKWRRIPDAGLAWMNFFILYVALPALFFRILSRTPLRAARPDRLRHGDRARHPPSAFTIAVPCIGLVLRRGSLATPRSPPSPAASATSATWAGPCARRHRARGRRAGGADLHVRRAADASRWCRCRWPSAAANLDAAAALSRWSVASSSIPLLIAAALGVGAAALESSRPRPSTACWSSSTRRPRPARCSRSASRWRCARWSACPGRCRCCRRQAGRAPDPGADAAAAGSDLQRGLGQYRRADGRPAAGAHGLRVRAPVRRLDRAGLQRRPHRHARLRRHPHRRHVARADPRPGAARRRADAYSSYAIYRTIFQLPSPWRRKMSRPGSSDTVSTAWPWRLTVSVHTSRTAAMSPDTMTSLMVRS